MVEGFTKVPLFIGCGKADFALPGARSLAASLKNVKGAKVTFREVTFREYDDIEHLLIVREAIPEVFHAWNGESMIRYSETTRRLLHSTFRTPSFAPVPVRRNQPRRTPVLHIRDSDGAPEANWQMNNQCQNAPINTAT